MRSKARREVQQQQQSPAVVAEPTTTTSTTVQEQLPNGTVWGNNGTTTAKVLADKTFVTLLFVSCDDMESGNHMWNEVVVRLTFYIFPRLFHIPLPGT